jgi:hypothetical protein
MDCLMNGAHRNEHLPPILTVPAGAGAGIDERRVRIPVTCYLVRSPDGKALAVLSSPRPPVWATGSRRRGRTGGSGYHRTSQGAGSGKSGSAPDRRDRNADPCPLCCEYRAGDGHPFPDRGRPDALAGGCGNVRAHDGIRPELRGALSGPGPDRRATRWIAERPVRSRPPSRGGGTDPGRPGAVNVHRVVRPEDAPGRASGAWGSPVGGADR